MRHRFPTRLLIAASAAMIVASAAAAPMAAADPQNGFKTKQPTMLVAGAGAPLGAEFKPIITVGDTIGSYRFEAIPDGISFMSAGKNAATVFVNHETSTVPFPYTSAPTPANSQNDFDNSQVSKLVVRNGGAVLSASYVISSNANYQRFCSSFLATSTDGFSRPILFNNEEGIDWVMEGSPSNPTTAWPAAVDQAGARQIGAVVAYDVRANTYKTIWGMGRLNHENNVPVPGYGMPVLLSGDDAFVSNPMQSQVYAYIAPNADAVWNDSGDLWAFRSSNADIDSYYDFPRGSQMSVSGEFVRVPKEIATGKKADGTDMLAAEVPASLGGPYPAPPTDGSWQRGPGAGAGQPGIDGPQWILEYWSDLNDVFQFVRIEDIATDKRPGKAKTVYLADSGRGLAGTNAPTIESPTAPQYPQPFTSSNGRVWKMVMNGSDPTKVDSLSIFIEGDDNPVKTLNEIHQPDNLETTVNGLYVTEDPGSSQQFSAAQQAADPTNATTARVWQYRFADGAMSAVIKVDQSADQGPTDQDGAGAAGNWGAWEASGIIDVSSMFGPGKFLVTVQAHSLWVEKQAVTNWTNKREGGQLVLVTIPGG